MIESRDRIPDRPNPDRFDRFYIHRGPITVIDMLSMEYYQDHTEGLGDGVGCIVRKDKIEPEGLLNVEGLVNLLLSFGVERGVTEGDLYCVPYRTLMEYQDIVAEYGIGSAQSKRFRESRSGDAALLACADASDFVRREYLKRKERRG